MTSTNQPHQPPHPPQPAESQQADPHGPHQHSRGHAHDSVIRAARFYHLSTMTLFLGQRGRIYRRLVGLLGARPGERALDIGSGTGALTTALAEAVGPTGSVVGIDPAAEMVAFAGKRAPANCTFRVMSAEALDLPDGSLDVIASTLAFHHLGAKDRATAEAYRVLRSGGRILIADFCPPRRRWLRALVMRLSRHSMTHDPAAEIPAALHAAGFVDIENTQLPPALIAVTATRP